MRICKQCLIRESEDKAIFENMFNYIRQLDEDIKTASTLYEERLAMCKTCEALINGMCKYCGCFVEMRAAIKRNYCPNKRW